MLLDKDNIRRGSIKKPEKVIPVGNNNDKGTILGFNLARDCIICGEPFMLDEVNDITYMCKRCHDALNNPEIKAKVLELILGSENG